MTSHKGTINLEDKATKELDKLVSNKIYLM